MGIESLLVFLIVGAIAGWLAGLLVKGYGFGLLGNIVVGIVGAFIAGWLLPDARDFARQRHRGRDHPCRHRRGHPAGADPADQAGLTLRVATKRAAPMKQNQLYLIIGALIVAVVALGIYVYREESKPDGVELRIDDSGISIEQN